MKIKGYCHCPCLLWHFKFSESASDIQLPMPLSFITQFAPGVRYVSALCIQLVLGIANGIGKPVSLETLVSDHSPSSRYRTTFSAQPELQQKYDTTWKDCFWLHE